MALGLASCERWVVLGLDLQKDYAKAWCNCAKGGAIVITEKKVIFHLAALIESPC